MPELPEVEIVKRGLEPVMRGCVIERCVLNRPNLRTPFHPDMVDICAGALVQNIERRGKYMIVHLDKGHSLIWHLGMSGRVHILGASDLYNPQKHDHVIFEMKGGARVVFNDPRRFGFIEMVATKTWSHKKPFSAMGPEPLGNDFSAPILQERLRTKKAPIKTALLDQSVVAGLGNIYVCEALYESALHPERIAHSITAEDCERLSRVIRAVLEKALAAGGSSLKDYKHTDGTLGYFQHMFGVYDREGQACPDCNCDIEKTGGVKRITQSGRSTFYCDQRQKLTKA